MVLSKLNSYSDVFALNEVELRELLASDDEPIRVWASWALGIKLNEANCPSQITSLLSTEPSAGVRQNLLVFIAGSGNYDLLEAYARTDPNTDVRAAACNLIARVAIDIRDRNYLLEEILTTDLSINVQATILNGAARDHRPIAIEVIRKIISNENPYLQSIALDVITVQFVGFYENTELLVEMTTWADHMHPDVYEKFCCLSYDLAGGGHLFAVTLARPNLAQIPIEILLKNKYQTTWRNLDSLSNLVGLRNFPRMLDLLNDDFDQDTACWLLKIMATDIIDFNENSNYGHYSQLRQIAMPRLYSILLKSKTPHKSQYAIHVLKQVRMDLFDAQSLDPDDTWDHGDNTAAIKYYEDFVARLEPWS